MISFDGGRFLRVGALGQLRCGHARNARRLIDDLSQHARHFAHAPLERSETLFNGRNGSRGIRPHRRIVLEALACLRKLALDSIKSDMRFRVRTLILTIALHFPALNSANPAEKTPGLHSTLHGKLSPTSMTDTGDRHDRAGPGHTESSVCDKYCRQSLIAVCGLWDVQHHH